MAEEKRIPLVLTVDGAKAIKTVGELKKGIADTRKELEKTEVGSKKFDELSESVKEAEGRMKELNAQSTFISDMPGPIGAVTNGFAAMKAAVMTGVRALFTLKGAIAATGIGLLLIALGSLHQYFSRTEKGAQQLRVIMATLGAAVDKVSDVFVNLGGKLVEAFNNPKQAIQDLGKLIKENVQNRIDGLLELFPKLGQAIELALSGKFGQAGKVALDAVGKVTLGVEDMTDKIGAATSEINKFAKGVADTAKEGAALEKALNNVLVKERELRVERAKSNKVIAEQRIIARDVNLSLEERIEALTMASDIEQELLERELDNERERLRIMQAKADLASSDEETLNAIADQQIKVANIEEQSLNSRRRIEMELITLRKQDEAEQKARNDTRLKEIAEQEAKESDLRRQLRQSQLELIADDEERELEMNAEKFEEKLELITGESELEQQLRDSLLEQRLQSEQDIRDKYAKVRIDKGKKEKDEQLKAEQDLAAAKVSVAQSLGSALGSIQNAITGQSKAAVTARKILAVAQIAIDTAIAVSGAIAQAQSVPFPANIAAIATGVAAVISGIASAVTTLNGANVGGATAPAPTAPSVPSAPTFSPVSTNTTELGNAEQANLAPIQAFVVETDVTGNQNNVNQIESQATFGGG